MKNFATFTMGALFGILCFILFIEFTTENKIENGTVSSPPQEASSMDEIILFSEIGECISTEKFEVFQVLDSGHALAKEVTKEYSIPTGLIVLFLDKDGKQTYYDKKIIKIPSRHAAKQIGIFKYTTHSDIEKTIPIVEICPK